MNRVNERPLAMTDGLISAVAYALATHPAERLGQIIVNATSADDVFYVEDSVLVGALNRYSKR